MDKPITLEELLASRDNRHSMQMSLLKAHPDKTLVCLTVVMPGSIKGTDPTSMPMLLWKPYAKAFHPKKAN